VHAAVAAIRRTNDSSFTLVFTGTPGKLASIHLKVGRALFSHAALICRKLGLVWQQQ
jgi:hypothetical protein